MQGLEQITMLLSEKLGIAFEFVESDLMFYVLEYGKFEAIRNIPINAFISMLMIIIFSAVACLVLLFLAFDFIDEDGILEFISKTKTKTKVLIFGLVATFLTVSVFWDVVLYLVSPQMYSFRVVFKLLSK